MISFAIIEDYRVKFTWIQYDVIIFKTVYWYLYF